VPEERPFNLDHYCVEGPLARTVEDCRLLENVMAGPHPADHTSIRPKLVIRPPRGGIRGWRVALSEDLGGYRVDPDVRAGLHTAADAFREAGAIVEHVDLGWSKERILEAARIHFASIFGASIARSLERHREQMTAYAIARAEDALATPRDGYLRSLEIEAELGAQLGEALRRRRFLICPTVAIPAFDAGDDYVGYGPVIDGERQTIPRDALMTLPFNICGRSPVMSVPSGIARNGVPTGIQIVGRPYDDPAVFRAAAAYEAVRPWQPAPM
jgi:aspartyl-tRNA(Asn)/glutamyl-tRNA(Gln) amidotransferase subunit A